MTVRKIASLKNMGAPKTPNERKMAVTSQNHQLSFLYSNIHIWLPFYFLHLTALT